MDTHAPTQTHHMQVFCSFHRAAVLVVLIIVVFKVFMRHKSLVCQDLSVLVSVFYGGWLRKIVFVRYVRTCDKLYIYNHYQSLRTNETALYTAGLEGDRIGSCLANTG